jgi:hypothetical protein
MEIKKLNRGDSFILNWSPMLLVPSLVGLVLSLWRGPVFMRYLIACAGLGLLFGTLVVLNYWKKRPTLSILGVLILIYGENLARSVFIGDVADGLGWVVVSQYLSLLLLSVFGLSWLFRQKILKRYE